jgi:hypothetical protein
MAIDFTLSPELEGIRAKTRDFIDTVVRPLEQGISEGDRMRIAQRTIASYKDTGSVHKAVGNPPI